MHPEALAESARILLPRLGGIDNFYLAGGSALALQIGHRLSEDLDFFSDSKIKKTLLPKIEKILEGGTARTGGNNSGELTLVSGSIKITFLHYPFPLLFPLLNYKGIRLANIREIACMKAYTIGRRGSFKDYVDIYFVLKEGLEKIENIIADARRKYTEAFDARLFLEQLLYLEDIQDMEIKFLKSRIGREEIKNFFQKKIKAIKL